MELWPSKQGSLFFWDTLYVHIESKLICETDFRVWSCSFYVWTDLELVILLCIVSSPSNRSEVYKVRSQKICCEISCIDCHLSKFKGHRSDCIITIFPGNFTRFFVFYSFCFIVLFAQSVILRFTVGDGLAVGQRRFRLDMHV